jgi:hypothetical protein
MRGTYEASIKIAGLTSARTLAYITAPAAAVVEILGASVTNASNETNEQLECTLKRVATLGAPVATTITPAKLEPGDQAAQSTVKGNVASSEPTYATNTELGYEGAPSLGGWAYEPGALERPLIPPGATLGLVLLQPMTSFDAIVRLRFRELG